MQTRTFEQLAAATNNCDATTLPSNAADLIVDIEEAVEAADSDTAAAEICALGYIARLRLSQNEDRAQAFRKRLRALHQLASRERAAALSQTPATEPEPVAEPVVTPEPAPAPEPRPLNKRQRVPRLPEPAEQPQPRTYTFEELRHAKPDPVPPPVAQQDAEWVPGDDDNLPW